MKTIVAPRVGAWIETRRDWLYCYCLSSRPAWARGLKHRCLVFAFRPCLSRPARARGLKHLIMDLPGEEDAGRAPRGRVD